MYAAGACGGGSGRIGRSAACAAKDADNTTPAAIAARRMLFTMCPAPTIITGHTLGRMTHDPLCKIGKKQKGRGREETRSLWVENSP